MDGEPEAALVARAAEGDTEAFQKLFEAHHQAMFRFAYRLTGASGAAEDITQECFLRLIQRSTFDGERGSLRQFLYGMVRNLARQRQQAAGRELRWNDAENPEPQCAASNLALSAELAAVVQAAIGALPPLQREALVLREFEELSLEQAAAVVRADIGTLKSRLYRARESLRRTLAPYRNQVWTAQPKGTNHDSTQ